MEPQTLYLPRKRGASVVLLCEAKVNIEGPLVKAVQRTPTWPCPPTDPPVEVEDANPPWNVCERTLIINMESYLQNSEELHVGIGELEFFLLGPGDEDISITFLAENALDEGGYSCFVLLDMRWGKEVADAALL